MLYLFRFQALARPCELCPGDEPVAVRVHGLEGLLDFGLLLVGWLILSKLSSESFQFNLTNGQKVLPLTGRILTVISANVMPYASTPKLMDDLCPSEVIGSQNTDHMRVPHM